MSYVGQNYPYSPLLLQTRTLTKQLGEDGDPNCQSCFTTGLTMLTIGGLMGAFVILAVGPALRLHREYRNP